MTSLRHLHLKNNVRTKIGNPAECGKFCRIYFRAAWEAGTFAWWFSSRGFESLVKAPMDDAEILKRRWWTCKYFNSYRFRLFLKSPHVVSLSISRKVKKRTWNGAETETKRRQNGDETEVKRTWNGDETNLNLVLRAKLGDLPRFWYLREPSESLWGLPLSGGTVMRKSGDVGLTFRDSLPCLVRFVWYCACFCWLKNCI